MELGHVCKICIIFLPCILVISQWNQFVYRSSEKGCLQRHLSESLTLPRISLTATHKQGTRTSEDRDYNSETYIWILVVFLTNIYSNIHLPHLLYKYKGRNLWTEQYIQNIHRLLIKQLFSFHLDWQFMITMKM